nr:RRXRR domain-containing protein [Ktedonobacter racemifer]
MVLVSVLNSDGRPLMPCLPPIARLLLKAGKAKVVRRTPFTIKLLAPLTHDHTQPLTLGIDTGSTVVGAAVADEQGKVVYLSEVELRNDVAATMKERAAKRRNRRQRKTRYRRESTFQQSSQLDEAGKILPDDALQNRGTPAGNSLCASNLPDHAYCVRNGHL